MFSSILEFFEQLFQFKLKKQKKDTQKEVKKEETKILQKAKQKLVGSAKEQAKKAEKVKDSKEKEKKWKNLVWLFRILKWIAGIIEAFINLLISLIGTTGMLVILAVVLIMIIIFGFLHIDMGVGGSGIGTGVNGGGGGSGESGVEDCIQGSEVIESNNFNLQLLSQLSGTLTEQQQNIYRCLHVYYQIINGDLGYSPWKEKQPETVNKLGVEGIARFLAGFSAVETGFNFNNGGKNVLEYTTNTKANSYGYGFLGLGTWTTLDEHATKIADAMRKEYVPKDTPAYESDFAPYAIAIQTTIMVESSYPYYTNGKNWVKNHETEVNEIINAYGLKENIDDLKLKLGLFMSSAYYHGVGTDANDNLKALASLWCALWSTTSDVDAKRSFDNIEVLYSAYAENTYRKVILGTGGYSNATAMWGQTVSKPAFKINNKEVDTVLWDWVWKNCTNPDYFESTAKTWLDSKAEFAGNGLILNGHYGLIAYLIGNKVVKDMGLSMAVSTGGNRDDCDEPTKIEGSFVETPGQFQGPWGDISSYIDQIPNTSVVAKLKNALPHVGKAPKNEGENNYLYNVDKWKAYNGKGTVRYAQNTTRNLGEDWGGLSFGDSTYYAAGCGIYSTACVLSTMLGKYINPVEIAIAISTYEQRYPGSNLALSNMDGGGGAFTHTDLAAVIKECGFSVETTNSFSESKINECLDNKGMVIYVVNNSYNNRYTSGGHYVVIREKTSTGYLVYSSTNWSNSSVDDYCNTENTMEELKTLCSQNGAQMVLVTPSK